MDIRDFMEQMEKVEILQGGMYRGKANDVCLTNHPGVIAIIATDRISAGNGAKTGEVPGKGQCNHLFAVEFFERMERAGIPTHYLGEKRAACANLVQKADQFKVEVLARFESAGSFNKEFNVPEGTPMVDKNGDPFVEFTYKSDNDGDPRVSDWSLIQMGILAKDEIDEIRDITKRAAHVLRDLAKDVGCKLIDFKLEFGRLPDGRIVITDECSSDTGRYRDLATGQKLDKDNYRQGESDETVINGYMEMLRRLLKLRNEDE